LLSPSPAAALWIIYKMQNGQLVEFIQKLKANREANAQQAELNRASMEKMAEGANNTAIALGKPTTRVQALPRDRRLTSRRPRK
jgi:hypothetical protein